jgi:primosomal protein N' (replication factor Y) (superfamily II helicase)
LSEDFPATTAFENGATPPFVPRYAVVVVNTSLKPTISTTVDEESDTEDPGHLARAFHYLILPTMQIREGQLVWVPFGARTLQGIVVGLDDTSPVENVRPLLYIVDAEPVLNADQLHLARWISDYYLAPLQQVILAMLPPGVLQPVETVIRLADIPETAEVTHEQSVIIQLLHDHDVLTLKRLQRMKPLPNWRAVISQLLRRDWVNKANEALAPSVRPKTVSYVRLLNSELTKIEGSKQKLALAYLLRYGVDWVPLRQASQEAQVESATFHSLATKGLVLIEQRQVWRDPLQDQVFPPEIAPELTKEQQQVWQVVSTDLENPQGKPFLLQGVTGSGKTEIYLQAVAWILQQGRGAIVLVPEISLTAQTIRRFGARFGGTLAVLHSRLSAGERYDQWRRIRAGELRLVVGARSALFAPIPRLGLVVLDEEHEWSYKQDSTPRYHARDAAVRLAQICGATCLLGSATPALESAYRVERGEYIRLTLPNRILGRCQDILPLTAQLEGQTGVFHHVADLPQEVLAAELPPVRVVDMRSELRAGNTSIFSRILQESLSDVLAQHQQAILFMNRRGSATFILCRDCGYVLACPRCNLPLTYHEAQASLICHHCGYHQNNVTRCPQCHSQRIRFFGAGTEKVEETVKVLFPQARVMRWDTDTTGAKGDHARILDQFIKGEADIMVGTQMVAKGLDLPRVTLVGVVSADTMIHLPDLRASERTFQLLTQVAGRAGRSALGGQVIIQSYSPDHPAIQAASHHDVDGFYQQEIAFRREHWYPPLSKLVALRYLNASAMAAQIEVEHLAEQLRQRKDRLGLPELDIIGPTPSFFSRIKGRYRWQILLRGDNPASLVRELVFPLGWQVDVDPVSLV